MSRPIARSGARSSIRGSFAVRAASASSPSSRPGAIAPPTYAPSAATQSNVVAVPKSTTTAGVPYSRAAASALTSRSAPDVARPVDADRERHRAGARDDERAVAPLGDRLDRAGHGRDDRGERDRVDVGDGDPVEPEQPVEQQLELVGGRPRVRRGAPRGEQRAGPEQADRDVRVADVEGEQHGADDTRAAPRFPGSSRRRRRCGTIAPVRPPPAHRGDARVSSPPAAKFFVNQGVVTSRTDMLHLLRPLLKQTVTYRYLRGREVVAHGTGWVERIVVDADDISTYFTPLAITLNIDSFEHLEFETRPDQLLVYTLVQGDERVVVEFAPIGPRRGRRSPFAPRQLEFDTSDYVQMELLGLEAREDE